MGKNKSNKNITVQHTNDSSILSKNSMIKQAYFKDDYLKYFAAKNVRRAPLINRGYYIRMKAVEHVMKTFLTSAIWANGKKQIISLGAGFDTSFFRFHDEGFLSNTTFFEVDFQEVVAEKLTLIKNNEKLSKALEDLQLITNQQHNTYGLKSKKYCLFSCNLKDIHKLENCLLQFGIDKSCPSLILSEVVLAYLDPKSSDRIIKWASEFFTSALFVTYEQVYPLDPFGIVMMKHFRSINSPLLSIEAYPDPTTQVHRYKDKGWTEAHCCDMNQFYFDILEQPEKSRIELLEPFDEFEEWQIKCAHYVIVTALKGCCKQLKNDLFPKFPLQPSSFVPAESLSCKVVPSTGNNLLQRYGHSACHNSDNKTILVYGGFGLAQAKHMRLDDICVLHQTQGFWMTNEAVVEDPECAIGPRMFHTATLLKDGSVFIYGGRTSPTKPCTSSLIMRLEEVELPGRETNYYKENACATNVLTTYTESEKENVDIRTRVCFTSHSDIENSLSNALSRFDGTTCHTTPYKSCVTETQSTEALSSDSVIVTKKEKKENKLKSGRDCSANSVILCDQHTEVTGKVYKIYCFTHHSVGDIPPPRWRNTTSSITLNGGRETLLVFGGCSSHSEPLGDCYTLDIESQTWRQVHLVSQDGCKIEPRHSHSATNWGRDVVLVGGMGKNLIPLSKVQVVRTQVSPMQVQTLNFEPDLEPRYAHTAHITGNTLVVIGGVTPALCPGPPTLVLLDLNSLRWQSFILPFCCRPSSPILLHNHCSVQVGPQSIMVLGGGGNCFSFGTNLNKEPFLIELPMSVICVKC